MENEKLKLMNKIKRKMIKGHDDFWLYWCISFDDWDKMVKKVCENGK